MDKLEKFISDHRAELDPVWDPATSPLDPSRFPQPQAEQSTQWKSWTLIVLLLVVMSSAIGYRVAMINSYTHASMAEASDIQQHYSRQVAHLAASPDYSQQLTAEDRELLSQLLTQLDREAQIILDDLQRGLDQDILLERLSLNYQKRLHLLESIITSPSRQSEDHERVYM